MHPVVGFNLMMSLLLEVHWWIHGCGIERTNQYTIQNARFTKKGSNKKTWTWLEVQSKHVVFKALGIQMKQNTSIHISLSKFIEENNSKVESWPSSIPADILYIQYLLLIFLCLFLQNQIIAWDRKTESIDWSCLFSICRLISSQKGRVNPALLVFISSSFGGEWSVYRVYIIYIY